MDKILKETTSLGLKRKGKTKKTKVASQLVIAKIRIFRLQWVRNLGTGIFPSKSTVTLTNN